MKNPIRYSHLVIPEAEVDFEKLHALESEHIAEWFINETEKVVVLKYASEALSEDELKSKIVLVLCRRKGKVILSLKKRVK
jgi:hypothetical protein